MILLQVDSLFTHQDSLCDHMQIMLLLFQIHGITVLDRLVWRLQCHFLKFESINEIVVIT
jgi:hypothetical protein